MTCDEFNKKYEAYIEEGFEGLEIGDESVIGYLDSVFPSFIENYPDFQFSQIKLKFGMSRFYTSLPTEINLEVERNINKLIYKK